MIRIPTVINVILLFTFSVDVDATDVAVTGFDYSAVDKLGEFVTGDVSLEATKKRIAAKGHGTKLVNPAYYKGLIQSRSTKRNRRRTERSGLLAMREEAHAKGDMGVQLYSTPQKAIHAMKNYLKRKQLEQNNPAKARRDGTRDLTKEWTEYWEYKLALEKEKRLMDKSPIPAIQVNYRPTEKSQALAEINADRVHRKLTGFLKDHTSLQMLSDPHVLEQMLDEDEDLREALAQRPELRQEWKNPDLLKNAVNTVFKDPQLMSELMEDNFIRDDPRQLLEELKQDNVQPSYKRSKHPLMTKAFDLASGVDKLRMNPPPHHSGILKRPSGLQNVTVKLPHDRNIQNPQWADPPPLYDHGPHFGVNSDPQYLKKMLAGSLAGNAVVLFQPTMQVALEAVIGFVMGSGVILAAVRFRRTPPAGCESLLPV